MIVNIKLIDIIGHPNNPRKELGDLTELAESIKEQGILQNITVVDNQDGTYTSIIGHRRIAAAKLAGLTEAPCTIAEMDDTTQVSVMLLENMQRSDLTVYEQAQGFQMCLNLGMSEDELSKKTGLSKKTVKHRVKMLELDQDTVKEKCKDASIFDFIQLEKVKDVDVRNEILKTMGTNNFNYQLQNAIRKEKAQKLFDDLIIKLELIAERLEKRPDWKEPYAQVQSWSEYSQESDFTKAIAEKEDIGTLFYYYNKEYQQAQLYKQKVATSEAPEKSQYDIEREERQAKQEEKRKLGESLFLLRKSFIQNVEGIFIGSPLLDKLLNYYTATIMTIADVDTINGCGDYYMNDFEFNKELYLELTESDSDTLDIKDIQDEIGNGRIKTNKTLLYILYSKLEEGDGIGCCDWNMTYKKDYKFELLYEFMDAIEYEKSDVEKQVLDGTHEMYRKE